MQLSSEAASSSVLKQGGGRTDPFCSQLRLERAWTNEDEMLTSMKTNYLIGTLILLVVVAAGYYFIFCEETRQTPTLRDRAGIVLFQGKPAIGARVTLFPENKADRFLPSGVVGEDGTFQLTSFSPNDGAPAGRYRVGIVRGRPDGDEKAELKKKHTPEEFDQIMAEKAQDPLYSKYDNAGLTAEIPAPGKQLRFELE